MCVAASGLMTNVILSSISFYLYYLFSLFNINCSTLLIFNFCSVGNVIYNLIPFVKLDGYWIFSSAIQITNLIEKSVIMFFTAIFKFREYSKVNVSNAKKLFLTFWGFMCMTFRPIFWILSTFTIRNFINNISYKFSIIVIILVTLMVAYNEFKFILYYIKKFKNNRKNILEMI